MCSAMQSYGLHVGGEPIEGIRQSLVLFGCGFKTLVRSSYFVELQSLFDVVPLHGVGQILFVGDHHH